MDVFRNRIFGEMVSVNGTFDSAFFGLRILCSGYMITGKVKKLPPDYNPYKDESLNL